MKKIDLIEVQRHINILNVAYHLCLEITDKRNTEVKAICPFCGYNKNSKVATLSLNTTNNKYCCSRCGIGGFSIGLYAKVRNIDTKKAYRELLDRECFSIEKAGIEISTINELVDIDTRDKIYRKFLSMLRLDISHRKYLENLGFLNTTIEDQMYKSIPKNYIKRRLVGFRLSKLFNLCGLPGFYQEEDFRWTFTGTKGFFIPVFDEYGRIKALSIHLDKEFNGTTDLWFSSKGKINGTGIKSTICNYNLFKDTKTVILTDSLLLGNFIKASLDVPIIAFSNIANSYQILREIEKSYVENIIFIIRKGENQNIDYIINRVFKDLIPLGYNLETKYIREYQDVLKEDFLYLYELKKVS